MRVRAQRGGLRTASPSTAWSYGLWRPGAPGFSIDVFQQPKFAAAYEPLDAAGERVRALQRRRAIAEAARAAGLGNVVRVHRQHSLPVPSVWVLGVLFPGIAAAFVSFLLGTGNSAAWQWPLFAWAVLMGVAHVGVHVGPVRGGRRWVAVADGGLILWSPHSVRTVSWYQARISGVGDLCNLGDVREAIKQRGPVGAWTLRRITGLALTVLVTAIAVWFTALPLALHILVGDRPTHLDQFARMCHGGSPFEQTAAYAGSPPHPIVVYGEHDHPSWDLPGYPDFIGKSQPDLRDKPDATQLVGCAQLISRLPTPPQSCRFSGGYGWDSYQGRYRIDIYEARTGRLVTSFNLDGTPPSTDADCPDSTIVRREADGEIHTVHTYPSEEYYQVALNHLMNGRVE